MVYHGRPMIMVSSNNYVGLIDHRKVKEAAIDAVRRYRTGCAGPMFLNEALSIHKEREEQLASLLGKESGDRFPDRIPDQHGGDIRSIGQERADCHRQGEPCQYF